MRFKKITYRIQYFYGGTAEVSGFAVEGKSGIRFCVRQKYDGGWRADHYDTGFSLVPDDIVSRMTMERLAADIDAQLARRIADGSYARGLQKAGLA